MLSASVVMPMRNAGPFVGNALRSLLVDPRPDIEVVVIDDGSDDDSRAQVLALPDSRVRLLDGPCRGISACTNVGVAAAQGDVLMFCDADDLYPPGRIAAQLRWLAEHPEFGAICGGFSTIDRRGRNIASPFEKTTADAIELNPELLAGRTRTSLCTFAIRRSAVRRTGSFREYFETAQDIDFQLRLASACRVAFVSENMYFYRLHDDSITHTQRSARREFFEATAREFQRQRALHGSDALMLGTPPVPPDGSSSRATRSRAQIADMRVGQSWRSLRENDHAAAARQAWMAATGRPLWPPGWWNLMKIMARVALRRRSTDEPPRASS